MNDSYLIKQILLHRSVGEPIRFFLTFSLRIDRFQLDWLHVDDLFWGGLRAGCSLNVRFTPASLLVRVHAYQIANVVELHEILLLKNINDKSLIQIEFCRIKHINLRKFTLTESSWLERAALSEAISMSLIF